jgi:anti-sigma factor RsiW
MNCQSTRDLLNGYADGELDLVNHLQIEGHLASCLACSRVYENHSALRTAAADSSLYFHAPPDLKRRIIAGLGDGESPPVKKIRSWNWISALAAASVIVVFAFFLFLKPGPSNDELLVREIVSSHIRSMMANHLTDVPSSDQHSVKPWFDGRLDFSPPVVNLTAQGFPLTGGRLDYIGSRPVAALVYRRRQHFINLFVFPSTDNSGSANETSVRQGYNVIRWNRSGMSFWAVSDLNLNELQDFTQALQN